MTKPVLLGICGALRAGSTNRKLLNEAARLFGEAEFSIADLNLPPLRRRRRGCERHSTSGSNPL